MPNLDTYIFATGLHKSKTRGRQSGRVRTRWFDFCLQLQSDEKLHRLQDRRSSRRSVSLRIAHF